MIKPQGVAHLLITITQYRVIVTAQPGPDRRFCRRLLLCRIKPIFWFQPRALARERAFRHIHDGLCYALGLEPRDKAIFAAHSASLRQKKAPADMPARALRAG